MKKKRYDGSAYDVLTQSFARLGFDDTDLGKKLINFTKKVDFLDAGVYYDYIRELSQCPGITAQDFFDKNYIERHNVLHRELMEQRERQRAGLMAIRYQQNKNQLAKEKEAYEKIAPTLCLWPIPIWVYQNAQGVYQTTEVRNWMAAMGVK